MSSPNKKEVLQKYNTSERLAGNEFGSCLVGQL